MRIKSISLLNYRNLREVNITLSPKINCLIGSNGMGKTNLLDAVYYLSFCKSTVTVADNSNILHDEPFFMLQGSYVSDSGIEEEVSCGLKRGEKKSFKRNGKAYERLSDHIGSIPLVMVSPADNELIAGGSEERRRFMDVVISQYDKEYLTALIRYNKALQQRNVMLRAEYMPDSEMFQLIEEMMTVEAVRIHEGRKRFVEELIPIFSQFHGTITGGSEQVSLRYRSHLNDTPLDELLAASRADDRSLGYTSKGVHRDELVMQLGGYPIKKEGSQGQNKSFLVSLKLAQFDFLRRKGGETPLLLLDDIFDKLDSRRVEQIVNLVGGEGFGQIFITDVNREHIDSILERIESGYRLFEVAGGEVELLKERSI
ncbi:MAG: DNA replication and repair protein RecF [Bacteroidaceae bacterium]|nr:DNA replication and repair protein RecF [Bacteroidaceae bacterium]